MFFSPLLFIFTTTTTCLQNVLGGLPQLKELNLYGNRLAEIQGCSHRSSNNSNSKLILLNVAYNDLVCLPETLPFPRLQSLIVSHNFLTVIPQALVLSSTTPLSSSRRQPQRNNNNKRRPAPLPRLRHLDVTSNPVTEPPAEVCERGLTEMRRYYKLHPQQQDSALSSSRRASGAAAAAARRTRRSHEESASSSMRPLFNLMGGHRDDDDDESGGVLVGRQEDEQEESHDVNALFQQRLQQPSTLQQQQPQGLLSQRRRPSNEVPLYISVESST
jgi:hypothetical protein